MFCGKCGTEVKNASFCPNCGNALMGISVVEDNTAKKKTKKNKTIGLGISVVVLAILVIGVVSIIRVVTAENYEEVAVKYAESYYVADYEGIKECLPYDVNEMFFDMFCNMCRDDDLSLAEGYKNVEEELGVRVNGAEDLLPKYCAGYAQVIYEESVSVEVEVLSTRKLEDYEIRAAIDENNDYYSEWGVNLFDYVEEDKIKKGYEVQLIFTYDEEGDVYSDNITYTVVKYGGKWKVLTIFDPDMY